MNHTMTAPSIATLVARIEALEERIMSQHHVLDDNEWEILFEDADTMILRHKETGKVLRCRKHATH